VFVWVLVRDDAGWVVFNHRMIDRADCLWWSGSSSLWVVTECLKFVQFSIVFCLGWALHSVLFNGVLRATFGPAFNYVQTFRSRNLTPSSHPLAKAISGAPLNLFQRQKACGASDAMKNLRKQLSKGVALLSSILFLCSIPQTNTSDVLAACSNIGTPRPLAMDRPL
jgi:hypothetical protein